MHGATVHSWNRGLRIETGIETGEVVWNRGKPLKGREREENKNLRNIAIVVNLRPFDPGNPPVPKAESQGDDLHSLMPLG